MRTEIVSHGTFWFTDKERAKCPECGFQNNKLDSLGKAEVKVKVPITKMEEGKEPEFLTEEKIVEKDYAQLSCQDCGCVFRVFK